MCITNPALVDITRNPTPQPTREVLVHYIQRYPFADFYKNEISCNENIQANQTSKATGRRAVVDKLVTEVNTTEFDPLWKICTSLS